MEANAKIVNNKRIVGYIYINGHPCSLTRLNNVCWPTSRSHLDIPKMATDSPKIEGELFHLRNSASVKLFATK